MQPSRRPPRRKRPGRCRHEPALLNKLQLCCSTTAQSPLPTCHAHAASSIPQLTRPDRNVPCSSAPPKAKPRHALPPYPTQAQQDKWRPFGFRACFCLRSYASWARSALRCIGLCVVLGIPQSQQMTYRSSFPTCATNRAQPARSRARHQATSQLVPGPRFTVSPALLCSAAGAPAVAAAVPDPCSWDGA